MTGDQGPIDQNRGGTPSGGFAGRLDLPVSRDDPLGVDRLGDLLGDVCEAPGASGQRPAGTGLASHETRPPSVGPMERVDDPARRVAAVWPGVVGTDVAANAQPVRLRGGRLTVSASSSAWAQTLQLMSEVIVERLNESLGKKVVEDIAFRHAGWEERPPRRPACAGEPVRRSDAHRASLTAEQREALDHLETLDLPPELRAGIRRAMEAAFVRGGPDPVR